MSNRPYGKRGPSTSNTPWSKVTRKVQQPIFLVRWTGNEKRGNWRVAYNRRSHNWRILFDWHLTLVTSGHRLKSPTLAKMNSTSTGHIRYHAAKLRWLPFSPPLCSWASLCVDRLLGRNNCVILQVRLTTGLRSGGYIWVPMKFLCIS